MQISTKIEYAVRGLVALFTPDEGEPMPIKEVCRIQNLPIKYMEQIFNSLRKDSLVSSVRGAHGGYYLARPLKQISLWDVMKALDELPINMNCMDREAQHEYCIGLPCSFYDAWQKIADEVRDFFADISLSRFSQNN